MTLKFQVETLEGLAPEVAALYSESDGKFYLDVEGAVSKTKLDEFRTTNVELMKKLDQLKDVDPVEYKKLKSDFEKLKSADANKPDVDKVVEDRVRQLREELSSQLDQANTTNITLRQQMNSLVIDSAVKDAAVKNGALGLAIDDLLLRAKTSFTVEDGVAIMKDASGHMVYDKDGSTPMSIDGWVKGLKKSAPHLFTMPAGGGSPGGGRNGGIDPSKMTSLQKISAGLSERTA